MKTSTGRCWIDADKTKLKYSDNRLFGCHFIPHSPTWDGLGWNPDLGSDMLATKLQNYGMVKA